MKKKLTAKIQQLNPVLPQYSESFSKCLIIEPETMEVVLKKGNVYAVFEIQGDASFDTELISKVTNDVIFNSYYQSESISPVQAMEKTISDSRDKIAQLSSDILRSDQHSVKFNTISSVLWGNVLYIVQYGEMSAFLMREGEIKPIKMVSEGNFSAFSQVINDDDVVIFCTKSFEKDLPPDKLLTTSISEQTLKQNQACLLIKVNIDTSMTEEEVVDFDLEKAIQRSKAKATSDKFSTIAKGILNKMKGVFSSVFKSKNTAKIPSIALPKISKSAVDLKNKLKVHPWTVALLVLVIALIILIPIVRKNVDNKSKEEEQQTQTPVNDINTETAKPDNVNTEEDIQKQKENDEKYKITRINPEVFYDLKISDNTAEPTDIVSFLDKVIAVDRTAGKIYISNIAEPKFTTESSKYIGIRSISNSDGKLTFLDDEGYKIYNIINSTVSEEYKINADLAFPYSGFVYTVSQDVIKKYKDNNTEPSVWEQSSDFKGAKSISIAYDIYLIKSDNQLASYSGGEKTDFEVKGLEEGIKEGAKIVADIDYDNLYVADKGAESVIILDKKGNLIKQYKAEKEDTWNDIRSISITPDEKVLLVLSGSKIYKIDL